jgi:large subunit ribosomal protein L33
VVGEVSRIEDRAVARLGGPLRRVPTTQLHQGPHPSTLNRVALMPRDKIILACSECKNRNYFTNKNKRLHPERVEWKKYCPRCNTHKLHKETK